MDEEFNNDLSLDNILTSEETSELFTDDEAQEAEATENKDNITEDSPDTLFTDNPESVGDELEQEQEDADSKGSDSSKSNFYSSIATALKEEGILPDLEEGSLNAIKTPEDFANAIENQLQSRLDDKQRRIDEALNVGIEPDAIKQFEGTMDFLDSIKAEGLEEEGDDAEQLRKQLIYNDFVNRGYSVERAQREVTKSLNAGFDVEDAKEALTSNKDFYKQSYQKQVDEAKLEEENQVKEREKQAEEFKKVILDTKEYEGISLDKKTRQRVLDNISKPVHKDEDGNYYTAIQKYERENRSGFMKNIGIIFTLTDGFKNLDGLVQTKVKKQTKRSLRELEHTLNNTSRNKSGDLQFASGVNDDGASEENLGFKLDI